MQYEPIPARLGPGARLCTECHVLTLNRDLFQFPVKDIKPRATICHQCWSNKLWMYYNLMPAERLNVLVIRQPSFDDLMATAATDTIKSDGQVGPRVDSQEDYSHE